MHNITDYTRMHRITDYTRIASYHWLCTYKRFSKMVNSTHDNYIILHHWLNTHETGLAVWDVWWTRKFWKPLFCVPSKFNVLGRRGMRKSCRPSSDCSLISVTTLCHSISITTFENFHLKISFIILKVFLL